MKRFAKVGPNRRWKRSHSLPNDYWRRLCRWEICSRFNGNWRIAAEGVEGLDLRARARARFAVGDIVTRAGDDLQRVVEVDEEGYCMTVVCIRAPASRWCKVGDEERNLCRRYQFPAEAIEGESIAPHPPPRLLPAR